MLVTDATARPHEAVALIESESPGALVEVADRRVYALVRAAKGGPPGALGTVEGLAARLRAYGPTGTSSRYGGADELRARGARGRACAGGAGRRLLRRA